MSAFAIQLAFVALGSVVTVDDNGPANFASISAAVLGTQAGDVIVVEPGTYGPFVLDKRLSILGRAGQPHPKVTGATTISAGAGFTVAGLDFDDLAIHDVAMRGRLDDCRVNPSELADPFVLDITNCAELELSRLVIHGAKGASSPLTDGGTALRLSSSRAVITSCELIGGQGGSPNPSHGAGANGGAGLLLRSGSEATVVACSLVRGGESGYCYAGIATCHTDGRAGDAVRANGAIAFVRGGVDDHLEGGTFWPDYGGTPGYAIDAIQSTAVQSGVSLVMSCICNPPAPSPIAAPGGVVVTPAVAEPYLTVFGQDGAGLTKTIEIVGPSGAAALLFGSLTSNLVSAAPLGSPLWFGLPALVTIPLTTQGTASPIALPVTMPSATGIEGVTLELQAVFPGIPDALQPSKAFVSNPAFLIVRP